MTAFFHAHADVVLDAPDVLTAVVGVGMWTAAVEVEASLDRPVQGSRTILPRTVPDSSTTCALLS